MADITCCSGQGCDVKDKCYRFTAPKTEFWQSYFCEPPIKDGKCDMYWGENAENVWNHLKDITNGSY